MRSISPKAVPIHIRWDSLESRQAGEWAIGKTSASCKFVGDAEDYLRLEMASPTDSVRLNQAIAAIKADKLVLEEWTDIIAFLEASP